MHKKKHKKLHHYNNAGHAHELTFSCYHRYEYFSGPIACQVFLDVLNKWREIYQFRIWAYVLMPNHIHLLIWLLQHDYDIAKIQSGLKGIMAKQYSEHLLENSPEQEEMFYIESRGKCSFRFWQPGAGFDRSWKSKSSFLQQYRLMTNSRNSIHSAVKCSFLADVGLKR